MKPFVSTLSSLLLALVLGCGLGSVLATPAHADELRPGLLELTEQQPGQWHLAWKQPLSAPPEGALPVPDLPSICSYSTPPEAGVVGRAIIGQADVICTGPMGGQQIGMPGMVGRSDMLVRFTPLDEPAQAFRLTSQNPQTQIAARPDTWQVLRTYFVLGVEHILAGWDHLLFVIALVLLVRNWRMVVGAATAFTVAHSITLAGASLGWMGLPSRPVEALIALSIVCLAMEAVRPAHAGHSLTARYPWVVAFLFGLLHGFGFAGALNEIGLPEDEIVAALLAFNIGVEAGQLLIIPAVLAALAALRRFAPNFEPGAIRLASYAIGITGAYWLIDRVIS